MILFSLLVFLPIRMGQHVEIPMQEPQEDWNTNYSTSPVKDSEGAQCHRTVSRLMWCASWRWAPAPGEASSRTSRWPSIIDCILLGINLPCVSTCLVSNLASTHCRAQDCTGLGDFGDLRLGREESHPFAAVVFKVLRLPALPQSLSWQQCIQVSGASQCQEPLGGRYSISTSHPAPLQLATVALHCESLGSNMIFSLKFVLSRSGWAVGFRYDLALLAATGLYI